MKIIKKDEKIAAAKKTRTKQIIFHKLKKIYYKKLEKPRLSPQEIRDKMVKSEEKRRNKFDLKLAELDYKLFNISVQKLH